MDKSIRELNKYAKLCHNETGEVCLLLGTLTCYSKYVSKQLMSAVVEEINNHLKNFKDNATIVEKRITSVRKEKSLKWGE